MIQITDPCKENFSGMSPKDNGRHCSQCDKTVVDFTRMTKADIVRYFDERKNQHICGRFIDAQLEKGNRFGRYLLSLRDHIAGKVQFKPARMLAVAITGILLSLNSCIMGMRYKPVTEHPNNLDHSQHTMQDSLGRPQNHKDTTDLNNH